MLQGRDALILSPSLSGDEELEGLGSRGHCKDKLRIPKAQLAGRLQPSGSLATEASPGLLLPSPSPAQPPPPGQREASFRPCQRDPGPLLPHPPHAPPPIAKICKISLRSLWVKPSQILPITVLVLSLSSSVPQGMCVWGEGGCFWCVWHVYVVCVVCVWCVCGV